MGCTPMTNCGRLTCILWTYPKGETVAAWATVCPEMSAWR